MLFSKKTFGTCLCILFAFAVFRYVYSRLFSRQFIPKSMPWVSQANTPWSRARITLQSFFHTRDFVEDGYRKYSKNNISFVLPNITTGPEVILPMSQLEWLLQQPDDVLSQNEVNRAFLQADHTMLHPRVVSEHIHEDVIRTELTKSLGDYVDDMQEEIDSAFRREWGVDTKNWNEVIAYESMLNVIARVSNRVLVGLPLCRNEEYLNNTKNFARLVVVQAIIISFIPDFLQKIFTPLINVLDYLRYLSTTKHTLPLIKQRLSSNAPDEKAKNDYITWSLSHSHLTSDPSQRSPLLISKRLTVLHFATIHLLSYLRTPITTTLNAFDEEEKGKEKTTKSSLSKMLGLHSVLIESMRLHGFVSRGVMKKVISPHGVTSPSGEVLPLGVNVCVHQRVHFDKSIYGQDAETFNPLRFMEDQVALVRTTGGDACPGRFFAAQQMKLVLAYIAINYDIEQIPASPESQWLAGSQGPLLGFRIRVRRRKGGV